VKFQVKSTISLPKSHGWDFTLHKRTFDLHPHKGKQEEPGLEVPTREQTPLEAVKEVPFVHCFSIYTSAPLFCFSSTSLSKQDLILPIILEVVE
jgi:hypothetical protein